MKMSSWRLKKDPTKIDREAAAQSLTPAEFAPEIDTRKAAAVTYVSSWRKNLMILRSRAGQTMTVL